MTDTQEAAEAFARFRRGRLATPRPISKTVNTLCQFFSNICAPSWWVHFSRRPGLGIRSPLATRASGRLSRRSPVVGADEAHRPAIVREKAEKPSIAIDNKRAVLSWPRRLKIRTASRHQSRRFQHHTAMSEITR